MMRQVLVLVLVATVVQGLKLNYGEEVAVCTLGSTLSTDARLHKALDKCGFYTMKESDYMEEEDEEDMEEEGRRGPHRKKRSTVVDDNGMEKEEYEMEDYDDELEETDEEYGMDEMQRAGGKRGKITRGKGKGGKGKGGKGKGGKGKGGKGKGGKGKGNNGKKCKKYSHMLKGLEEKSDMDMCILESLGWLDQYGNMNTTIEESDIASLMPQIGGELLENGVCIKESVDKFEEYLRACGKPKFTEGQIKKLLSLYAVESAGNCLLGGFFKACSEMVNNAVEFVFGNDWTEVEASQLSTAVIEGLSEITGLTQEVMAGLWSSLPTFLATLTSTETKSLFGTWYQFFVPCFPYCQ